MRKLAASRRRDVMETHTRGQYNVAVTREEDAFMDLRGNCVIAFDSHIELLFHRRQSRR